MFLQGTNGRFELKLDGADKEPFAVTPANGISEGQIQIVIRNPVEVDYETTTSMVLQVHEREGRVIRFIYFDDATNPSFTELNNHHSDMPPMFFSVFKNIGSKSVGTGIKITSSKWG